MSELRRRHTKFKSADTFEADRESEIKSSNDTNENPTALKNEPQSDIPSESFWLTRVVFLRYLGFIYFIAFLISFNQNKELIGSHGLTPASNFLLNGKTSFCFSPIFIIFSVGQRFEDAWSRMVQVPSLLWLAHPHYDDLDSLLDGLAITGACSPS